MKNVLVAGASGYLGKFVVKEFKKQGYIVHALVRDEKKIEDIREDVDHVIVADVTDRFSIAGVCEEMDIVFSSVGITKQKDNLTYNDVDYQANLNLLKEAKKEAVDKFIYVSVFNIEKLDNLKCVKAKLEFGNALKESGMDYTIIYPNGFFSDMLEYLEMAKKGRGFVFGKGENKINPIHGADLAVACVNAVKSQDKEINIGGPEVLTHNEILDIAFDIVEKPEKISRIPDWLSKIILGIMRRLSPVRVYGPIEFFMTVLSVDMIAPAYGQYHLKQFFRENV